MVSFGVNKGSKGRSVIVPTIGRGTYDGGFTKVEARYEFLRAVDRVFPECREELLELTPLVGEVEGLPFKTVALLENRDYALTVPRTPQDVQEVDVELVDGRVVRTTVVTRSAWRETWDALLEALDWWAKRWNVPPWMREVARATVVYAAAGWSRSWRLPPFEVHPYEPVSITVETPSIDLTRHAWTVEELIEHLQPWLRDVANKLLDAARAKSEEAGLSEAPDVKERDVPFALRWEWTVLSVLKGYSWRQIEQWTKERYPDLAIKINLDGDTPNKSLRNHVKSLTALLD